MEYDKLAGRKQPSRKKPRRDYRWYWCGLLGILILAFSVFGLIAYIEDSQHEQEDYWSRRLAQTATNSKSFCTTNAYATWSGGSAPASTIKNFTRLAVMSFTRLYDQVTLVATFQPLAEDSGGTDYSPQPYWTNNTLPEKLGIYINSSCFPPILNDTAAFPYPSLSFSGPYPIVVPQYPYLYNSTAFVASGRSYATEYLDASPSAHFYVAYASFSMSYTTTPDLFVLPDTCISSCVA